jgi:hypothetical protein
MVTHVNHEPSDVTTSECYGATGCTSTRRVVNDTHGVLRC